MTDLDRLIAAVEAGDDDFLASDVWIESWDVVAPSLQTYRMKSDGESAAITSYQAHAGSLDAALRLHREMFADWVAVVHSDGGVVLSDAGMDRNFTASCNDNPARSWLLAILRALKAKDAADGDV